MDDQQFRQILDHYGYSWEGYRRVRKGVKKRISRHMQQLKCRNIDEYLRVLDREEEQRNQFVCEMSVSVSRFFRDRILWKIIEDQIVQEISKENIKNIRFWSAGCACGEEVYSFKIVWESLCARFNHMPELEIVATDINPDYIRRAQEGVYPVSSLKEVPRESRETYFQPIEKDCFYRIIPSLKKGILWKVHNLLCEHDECGFQIIFLRNSILTYYNEYIKQPAFQKVMNSLDPGGFLIIGSHEELPIDSKDLFCVGSQPYIFKKIEKER